MLDRGKVVVFLKSRSPLSLWAIESGFDHTRRALECSYVILSRPPFNFSFLSSHSDVIKRVLPSVDRLRLKATTLKFVMSTDSTATEPAEVSTVSGESAPAPVNKPHMKPLGSRKSRTNSPGGRDAKSIPLPANVNQKRIYYLSLIHI